MAEVIEQVSGQNALEGLFDHFEEDDLGLVVKALFQHQADLRRINEAWRILCHEGSPFSEETLAKWRAQYNRVNHLWWSARALHKKKYGNYP